jgi:hypothetical protein
MVSSPPAESWVVRSNPTRVEGNNLDRKQSLTGV